MNVVLLQEKKLLDLPKLLDICSIYGHENEELTGLLVSVKKTSNFYVFPLQWMRNFFNLKLQHSLLRLYYLEKLNSVLLFVYTHEVKDTLFDPCF